MTTKNTTPGGGKAKPSVKRPPIKPKSPATAVAAVAPILPKPEEAKQIEVALGRVRKRAPRFEISILPIDGVTKICPTHDDAGGYMARATDTFGTRSPAFTNHMMERITLIARAHGQEKPTAQSVNAALAFVDGFAPDTEIEAMMATLLYATSDLALTMVTRAKQATDVPNVELSGNLAAKLMRSATAQAEALAKLRRGGEQTVRVEHVHVHAGGQAIVGNVAQGVGGQIKAEEQAHAISVAALDYAHEPISPLWSAHSAREPVPVVGDVERAMSDARRQ